MKRREVTIDLSGWEGYRAPGEVGIRPVPVDPRVERALQAAAWPAARIWCPEASGGVSELLAELMMTAEGPLVLVYVQELDTTSLGWLLKPLARRKLKPQLRGIPVMLADVDVLPLTCVRHGAFTAPSAALRDATANAVRGNVRNLTGEHAPNH